MNTPPTSLTHQESAQTRRGIIVMLLSVLGFSVNTLLLKYLGSVREIPSLLPLVFRAGVGIFIVLVFFRGRRPTRIRPVFTEPLLFWRGLTGLLGTAAYYWTVPSLGAGKATLFCNTYVIFAALIAALALGESLTWKRFIWLALAFAGIVFLAGPQLQGPAWSIGLDEMIALFGAVMAAASVVLVRQLTVHHSIGTIYLAQCVWIFVPMIFLTSRHLPALSGMDWTLLIVAATAASYGQLAMNEGYRCLSVTTGASLQMLWPVLTAIGGLAWFDERFAPLQLVGAVLILVSIWAISTRKA
ncbi:MAG: DMT family transporter [Verrucomicrobiae bacterium]|nr:DMT family transporter [Verrucomicrobiae bacterium]